jgi:hypothetical protein
MRFVKNTEYYRDIVYEWNLPTGSTCPFAKECKVTVDRVTGKFHNESNQYRCYAASPERFPGVREHRWRNYEWVKKGRYPILPKDSKAVRIHASGDFFNQQYFDLWLDLCRRYPGIEFWAYTKSLTYWVNRLDRIPRNLQLTASLGGRSDDLVEKYNLKHTIVYKSESEVPDGIPIDTNDDCARNRFVQKFALIDNFV